MKTRINTVLFEAALLIGILAAVFAQSVCVSAENRNEKGSDQGRKI